MLPKKLLTGVLPLLLLFAFTGCAAYGHHKDPEKIRYQRASDDCIRYGFRRGSYDYNSCMEKRLKATKKNMTQ